MMVSGVSPGASSLPDRQQGESPTLCIPFSLWLHPRRHLDLSRDPPPPLSPNLAAPPSPVSSPALTSPLGCLPDPTPPLHRPLPPATIPTWDLVPCLQGTQGPG